MDQTGSLLSMLTEPALSPVPMQRALRLFGEGLLYSAAGLYVAHLVGIPQSGFFAIFLSSAGLTERFNGLLEENQSNIYEKKLGSWRSNAVSAWSVLALFLGMFVAFAAAAQILGEVRLAGAFGFALEAAHLGEDSILSRRFPSVGSLIAHNSLVLVTFVSLAFLYRAYGALLAMAWNACIWGVVLTALVRRGLRPDEAHPVLFVIVSSLAVLPHLLLEAAAYVVASLGSIFMSKGILKYGLSDPLLRRVALAVLLLVASGELLLVVAGAIEATLPPFVFARLL